MEEKFPIQTLIELDNFRAFPYAYILYSDAGAEQQFKNEVKDYFLNKIENLTWKSKFVSRDIEIISRDILDIFGDTQRSWEFSEDKEFTDTELEVLEALRAKLKTLLDDPKAKKFETTHASLSRIFSVLDLGLD